MKSFTVNCTGLAGPAALHRALAETLGFPAWYGHNLDALMDCLTDIDTPTHLRLYAWQELGAWKEPFADVFADAAAENPDLSVQYDN